MRNARARSAKFVLWGFLWLLIAPGEGRGEQAAQVQSFSPEGEVRDVRQVRATFSEAMIPFGDPRAAATEPFEIHCPEKGKARWADPRSWIFDFEKDLPAGVKCSFKLKPGLKSLSGATEFSFSTGGPAVRQSRPWEGDEVQEDQAFLLTLDGEVAEKSVLENAYFLVEGIEERIPARLIQGKQRDEILKATTYRWRAETKAVPQVILQAQRPFPPGAKIRLVWGKEIKTASGVETSEDQKFPFRVRKDFSAAFSCEREHAGAPCIPIGTMTLSFSAPVPAAQASEIRLKAANGRTWKPRGLDKPDPAKEDESVHSVAFEGPFAEKSSFRVLLPKDLRDDSGRKLLNASKFPLEVATGEYTPLAKFPAEFGILELKPEAVLPVTLRNLEPAVTARLGVGQTGMDGEKESVDGKMLRIAKVDQDGIVDWFLKIRGQQWGDGRGSSILGEASDRWLKAEPLSIPKPNGARAFEVVGIPLRRPGFYVIQLESPKLGAALLEDKSTMYVSTAALVTNLGVHFKQGRESSLAWVTTLDGAQPVEGALISVRDCQGKLLGKGKTGSQGFVHLPGIAESLPRCQRPGAHSDYLGGFFVFAEKDEDFSFVHSTWQKGIEFWRFNLPGAYEPNPNLASTVLDRMLFRAGEKVSMKHFVRKHTGAGFAAVDRAMLPKGVQLRHQGSDQKYELALKWEADDTAESAWTIPRDAKLGTYAIQLLDRDPRDAIGAHNPGEEEEGYRYSRWNHEGWESGSFRVEEYRVPLMKGTIRAPSEKQVNPEAITLDVGAEYLSGGGAGGLAVQVRHKQLEGGSVQFEDFEEFVFAAGRVRQPEGHRQRTATAEPKIEKQSLVLDRTGNAWVKLSDIRKVERLGKMQVELEFRDPNGEIQTAAQSLSLYPANRLVGIKPDGWYATRKGLKFQVAVADLSGKAVPGSRVVVDFVELKTYSHRKKLLGGFYGYENRSELKRHGKACEGQTDEKGVISCETTPPFSGNLLLEARTRDEEGNESVTHASTWIYDGEEWWFSQEDHDRIDVLPEKKTYQPGEKAVFQVRMPFREAMALVTVEREGVLESFTVPLSGKKPLVEVPIKENYAPNAFISVLVVRGRVGEPQPTALLDLGKPAYKLGIAEVRVGWKAHQLQVQVSPDKELYKTRETARVKLRVATASGAALPAGSEVIVAAVDEGLLQLKPNTSWELLAAMMGQRGYEVRTMTAQSQVVGKRHFGLKALPPGGDGGKAPTRELFDTLLYWNPRVRLDSKGEAQVEIPLNDSITAFKIVAVAHGGLSLYGTGASTIRATQDLMVFSGIPPVAREGDRFSAEMTVKNAASGPVEVTLSGKVTGLAEGLASQKLALAPGESKIARWSLQAPTGIDELKYEIEARSSTGFVDRIRVSQAVLEAVPVRAFQATLAQVDPSYKLKVELPKDALQGKGSVRVTWDPTLLSGLAGVKEYMQAYPYSCMEQKASRSIALRDQSLWERIMAELPVYLDDDGLVKYFPQMHWGSETLTSYLLSISHEAGWSIPEGPRKRMIDGLKKFVLGRITRWGSLPTADLSIRKIAAVEALSRYQEARATLLGSIDIAPNLWPTSAVIDWYNILSRVGDIPEKELRRSQAEQVLRSRLNFQGTVMGFSTGSSDRLWWLMVSEDVNANRMVLAALEQPARASTPGPLVLANLEGWSQDLPRMTRGAILRQKRGHWDTTTANAWGVLATEKFAAAYEKDPVQGTSLARLAGKSEALGWSESPKGKVQDLAWPAATAELELTHSGAGKPWATIQSRVAIPLKEPFSSGYKIHKTWTPVERKNPKAWTRGDVVRVKLSLEAQSDMTWVVVNDPIPAGASILGSGLGGDSSLSIAGEKREGWVWPAFEERKMDVFRSYYEYVPEGKWTIEYTLRLNQSGQMSMPPTRVEAMYAPEMLGESPNEAVTIAD